MDGWMDGSFNRGRENAQLQLLCLAVVAEAVAVDMVIAWAMATVAAPWLLVTGPINISPASIVKPHKTGTHGASIRYDSSEISRLKCLLQQQNIVRVWRLGSDLMTWWANILNPPARAYRWMLGWWWGWRSRQQYWRRAVVTTDRQREGWEIFAA